MYSNIVSHLMFVYFSEPDMVKTQAYKIKMQFFTYNTLTEICQRLISQYFLLTSEDLNTWDTDPEEFCKFIFYPPTKSEGYRFGVVRASVRPSVHSVRPSVRFFCLSGTISQYLLVRFNSFLVQMISTMNSRYPISLVKIDPLTLELLPLFKYRQL